MSSSIIVINLVSISRECLVKSCGKNQTYMYITISPSTEKSGQSSSLWHSNTRWSYDWNEKVLTSSIASEIVEHPYFQKKCEWMGREEESYRLFPHIQLPSHPNKP